MKTIFGLAALIFTVYFSALSAGYVQWDDHVFILENSSLQLDFADFIRQIFTNYFFGDYLPLTLLSYWSEVQVAGVSAPVQHLTNLLLHFLNVVLLWKWLPLPKRSALWVALVFAVHPMQSESVMWISERKTLLAIFFALLALHASKKAGPLSWKWTAAYTGFFCFSLLSKASVILLPVLLIFRDRLTLKRDWIFLVRKHAAVLLVALVWGIVRTLAYGQHFDRFAETSLSADRFLVLPGKILAALGFYISKFFYPVELSAIYPPFESVQAHAGWILIALVFLAGSLWRIWKTGDPQLSFFLAWTLLFLLPVLQIVPRINFVNDRYLYFPIVGIAGMIVTLAPWISQKRPVIAVLSLVMALLCIQRAQVWTSNENLWADVLKKNPQNGLAHNNLGLEYLNQQRVEEAVFLFERGLQLGLSEGTSHLAANNLGTLFSSDQWGRKDLARAETYFRESIRLAPQDSDSTRYNLAVTVLQQGRAPEARDLLRDLEQDLSNSKDQRSRPLLEMTRKLLSHLN